MKINISVILTLIAFNASILLASEDPYAGIDWSIHNTSPLIDAGDRFYNAYETDLGGYPRILGDNIDIGAYEVMALPVLGIDSKEFSESVTSFYPNPASSILFYEGDLLTVYTISGVMLTQSVEKQVDISSLTAGYYIVAITSDKGVSHSILIKE